MANYVNYGKMSLQIDLRNAITGRADNFTVKLMQLMMKADCWNFERLRSVYPEVAEVVEEYKKGLGPKPREPITPTKGVNLRI